MVDDRIATVDQRVGNNAVMLEKPVGGGVDHLVFVVHTVLKRRQVLHRQRLYQQGRVRAIGVSNFFPDRLVDLCQFVEIRPMVNQVELHPYFTQESALETMKYYEVQPEAWAPLGGGRYKPFDDPMLQKIAAAHGKTVGQVILRWNVQRGVVVIPKSTHKERIEENIDIWDFTLTEEEMKRIASLDMGYEGTAVKHFDTEFVRMCNQRKIHN